VSILPELIIQQTLIRGIRAFRENEKLTNMLFRNVDVQERQAIRDFLRNDSIEICINYPDQDLKVPHIVILLKSESESQPFIGDLQQSVSDLHGMGVVPFSQDELMGEQTIVGSGSVSQTSHQPPVLVMPTKALSGTAKTIMAPESVSSLIDPFESEVYLVIIEGVSKGDKRLVDSIMPVRGEGVLIEVTEAFTIAPDATTIFKLIGPYEDNGVTGIPEKIYKSTDKIERMGTVFKCTYQLDMSGTSPEAAIYLYNIVKAIFFAANDLLIKQGFLTFVKMSGSDIAPILDYSPTPVYRRSLSIDFEYSFDVFKEITEPLAREINVVLSVHDPDVAKYEDTEVVVSETTITVS
jgi:hypothetical protein